MHEAVRHRREALKDYKRSSILEAAKRVFSVQGLEGASIRTIAKEAGYTSGAIYAYFPSKEAIYAAILRDSGEELCGLIEAEADNDPKQALRRKLMTMYQFYRVRPRDLELSLYLARGTGRKGLTPEYNRELNDLLVKVLSFVGDEIARIYPKISDSMLKQRIASLYGAIIGVVILSQTGRLQTLGADPQLIMLAHVDRELMELRSLSRTAR
jgi:AcrR family transcriptional regulator